VNEAMSWRKRSRTTPADSWPTPVASLDTCDACGWQAFVYALLPNGGEVLLCLHHGTLHAEALRRAGALVRDESYRLAETASR
jgi:hypothetical protein